MDRRSPAAHLTPSPRLALLVVTALLLVVFILGPARATAGETFDLHFDDAEYIVVPRGAEHGLSHRHTVAGGATIPASTGTLHDRKGAVIGHFATVFAGGLESTARVEDILPGFELSLVDHVGVDDPPAQFLTFRAHESDRFFYVDRGWGDSKTRLKHGSKGVLRDSAGRTGALFTVVAVDETRSLGMVTEYRSGYFNRDLVSGETLGFFNQVVSSSGFANLTVLNLIMLSVGVLFLFLGIKKEYEPLLLVPIGFGILVGNIPLPPQIFNAISVYMIDPITQRDGFFQEKLTFLFQDGS